MIPILSFIPTSLLRPLGKLLAALLVLVGVYYYGSYKGAQNCVQEVSEATVKALKKKYEDEQKRADMAVKRASDVAKELEKIKHEQDEDPITDTCPLNGDSLRKLESISRQSGGQPPSKMP